MNDLVKILLRYHAYNASNLDGGNSSVMVVNDKIINHPFNWDNREETRPIASGFVVVEWLKKVLNLTFNVFFYIIRAVLRGILWK